MDRFASRSSGPWTAGDDTGTSDGRNLLASVAIKVEGTLILPRGAWQTAVVSAPTDPEWVRLASDLSQIVVDGQPERVAIDRLLPVVMDRAVEFRKDGKAVAL